MSGANHTVEMNDGNIGIPSGIKFGLHNPKSSVFVWLILVPCIPADKGTRIQFSLEAEAEEEAQPDNSHAEHAFDVGVHGKESAVITRWAFPPRGCCSKILPAHAPRATWIAGRIKSCHSRVMDVNFAIKQGAS